MIIASNFKTNHTRNSTYAYLATLQEFITKKDSKQEIYIFPPSTALDGFTLSSQIHVGVQNAYPVEKGSFTGEIGLEQINEFGLNTILIGHSERRHILGESQALCAKKFDYFKEQGFEIVYCIGEPLEVREKGIDEVMAYNLKQLEGIDLSYDKLIVAYEPVWAIGTGVTASPQQIEETLGNLRHKVKAPLLYGGSVKVSSTKEILEIKNCDGILVGTASWDVDSFCQMIEIADSMGV